MQKEYWKLDLLIAINKKLKVSINSHEKMDDGGFDNSTSQLLRELYYVIYLNFTVHLNYIC